MFLRQIILIAFAVILGSSATRDDKRYKRVINGVGLIGRPTTYTAIRYYGVMTTISYNYYRRKIQETFYRDFGHVICSGSLLTPKIFQTACHCVATPVTENPNDTDTRVIVDNHWAGRTTIFFGVSNRFGEESIDTYSPVLTQKYIIHQKCARKGTIYVYDFALIQLPYEWIKADDRTPYPWTEIEYAPVYTIKTIRQFFFYALQKLLVCLHVGFGNYYHPKIIIISDILRTGWSVLSPQSRCYDEFSDLGGKRTPLDDFSYACGLTFPKHDQRTGQADSGGPVTCQNELFALVEGGEGIDTVYSPIYFNLFVNAIEYREDLIHSIDDLVRTYKSFVDDFYTTSKRRRPPGFVVKMHDTPVLGPEKTIVPWLRSQGQAKAASTRITTLQRGCILESYAGLFALNIAICIHTL